MTAKFLLDGEVIDNLEKLCRSRVVGRFATRPIAIENDIRGLLRNFGLKVGVVGTVKFEERICELVEGMPISKRSWSRCWPPGGSCVPNLLACTKKGSVANSS